MKRPSREVKLKGKPLQLNNLNLKFQQAKVNPPETNPIKL